MNRAVIYLRVSTSEQVTNSSLDTQYRDCMEFCRIHNIEVDRVFREEGESAKSADRRQLQEMLRYCTSSSKSKGIDLLVVHKFDRFARHMDDHIMIKIALINLGIRVKAVQEDFDDTPSGRLMENITAVMAQFDNDVRAFRTTVGMKEGLTRGRWMWRPPIGYTRPNGGRSAPSLIPDPESAPLILRTFELASTGQMTMRELWERMNVLGLRNQKDKPVSLQRFGQLLKNPIYVGRIVVPGWDIDCPGDFQPIVEQDLFDAVQAVRSRKLAHGDGRQRDHPDFPLRRFVRCGRCDAPLTGSWSTGRSGRYAYYHCPRRGCGGINVRKDHLEELFMERLEESCVRREAFDLLEAVVRDAWAERGAAAKEATQTLERKRNELQERSDQLVDALVHDKSIDQETYERQRGRIDGELRTVEEQAQILTRDGIDLDRTIEFARSLLTDLPGCWNQLSWSQRPGFLRSLYPNGMIFEAGAIGTTQNSWLLDEFGGELSTDERLAKSSRLRLSWAFAC